jgi:hypothetical protein
MSIPNRLPAEMRCTISAGHRHEPPPSGRAERRAMEASGLAMTCFSVLGSCPVSVPPDRCTSGRRGRVCCGLTRHRVRVRSDRGAGSERTHARYRPPGRSAAASSRASDGSGPSTGRDRLRSGCWHLSADVRCAHHHGRSAARSGTPRGAGSRRSSASSPSPSEAGLHGRESVPLSPMQQRPPSRPIDTTSPACTRSTANGRRIRGHRCRVGRRPHCRVPRSRAPGSGRPRRQCARHVPANLVLRSESPRPQARHSARVRVAGAGRPVSRPFGRVGRATIRR